MELAGGGHTFTGECNIEFETSPSWRMRVQRKGAPAPGWSALLRAWRQVAGVIRITPQMRVLVAVETADGRKGIDSLARFCVEKLAENPFSGCGFIFRSRRGTSVRLLTYDGQCYCGLA